MKRTFTVLAAIGFVFSAFAVVQWRKCQALDCLNRYGEVDDWEFFRHPLAPTPLHEPSIPRWLPGVWPRSLAINKIPADTARYAAAVKMLPGLDMIMVFVYKPMNTDIFTALGAVPDVKRLDLTSTSVNDSGFQQFTQFATVKELFLGVSTITDASMQHILQFRNVRELEINKNALSDSKVLELSQLPALHTLSLDHHLSSETIAALRLKRPDLQVQE